MFAPISMYEQFTELESDDFFLGLESLIGNPHDLESFYNYPSDDIDVSSESSCDVLVPSYTMNWCFKSRKPKPQQYWVYCEASQINYAKFQFQAGDLDWNSNSRVMRLPTDPANTLIFVEDGTTAPLVRGIRISPNQQITFVEEFPVDQLILVPNDHFQFSLEIEEDDIEPVHPQQGRASAINCSYEFKPSELPPPFSYFIIFSLTNRSEGWFRFKATLTYNNEELLSSRSSIFMLNNPRMKKHKEFHRFAPEQVKFMQLSVLKEFSSEQMQTFADSLGYSSDLTQEMFSLAANLFDATKVLGKRRSSSPRKPSPKRSKKEL